MPQYVCLQPCLGINHAAATIARQACYVVMEDLLPGQVHLGCAPALNAHVQEDIDFITNDFVICLEACEKDCATTLVRREGGNVHLVLPVHDILKEADFDPEEESPVFFAPEHPAVQALAHRIAEECRKALGQQSA